MKNSIITIAENLPAVLRNTHLNVTLAGWPAAVTVIAMCSAGVAAYALKVTHDENADSEGISIYN